MRCQEPGWVLCAMHDPTGRRGVWMRVNRSPMWVELCGGREGDDYCVKLMMDREPTPKDLWELVGILDTQRWMLEENG